MLPQNFTTKSQEAIQLAHQLAYSNGQPAVEPVHLLAALFEQDGGVVPSLIKKMQVDLPSLKGKIDQILLRLPKMGGQGGSVSQIYLSQDTGRAFGVGEHRNVL
jgi:ATP-dependent Clp protease ATP-binding subunit ClpB